MQINHVRHRTMHFLRSEVLDVADRPISKEVTGAMPGRLIDQAKDHASGRRRLRSYRVPVDGAAQEASGEHAMSVCRCFRSRGLGQFAVEPSWAVIPLSLVLAFRS